MAGALLGLTLSAMLASAPVQAPPPAPSSVDTAVTATADTATATTPATSPQPTQASQAVTSGLPRRTAFPRTMAEFWPVFAGLTVAWMAILSYMLSFGRRIRRTSDALEALVDPGEGPPPI